MKYVLLTSAKFFMFKLAESLHSSGNLERIVTGYPKIMLKEENLPFEKIESHSIFQIADYGIRKLNLKSRLIKDFTSDANRLYLDKITSSRIGDSDLISMSSLSLYTARKVKSRGNKFIVNRSSFHILNQREILLEVAKKWNWPEEIPSKLSILRELEEYEMADKIVVPSLAAYKSFISSNVREDKLVLNPFPIEIRNKDVLERERSGILFVGNVTLQKGFPTLVQAFNRLGNSGLILNVVGAYSPKFINHLSKQGLNFQNIVFHGHMNRSDLARMYLSNDIFVLPSVHDGWGMVVNEAISFGCIPIVSNGAGAGQLIQNGVNGFTFISGDTNDLLEKIQNSLGNEQMRYEMNRSLTGSVGSVKTWDDFARVYLDL